ncbi:hypothetical protein ILUMI_18388 [Ignelater luminosus]|uniref:HTH psq-type domain-containing protein n=1 Tax=Ignelater luminosus TaxID=2038154 RepID=A0A8K0CQ98_IGNLU|nr:hypothetical protein ILUMI_18388 [Ignelater luminosus]
MHQILIHGAPVTKESILPIGELSEEVQEAKNKDLRKFRRDKTRKISRLKVLGIEIRHRGKWGTLERRMPRHYERKTTPRYEIEDLRRAIQDVRSKQLSLGKAAIKYSVPETTLFKQVNPEVFKEQKKSRYPGITPKSLRKIAFTFAEANKLKHTFNKKSQLAGKDWYYSFMSRYPSIGLRTPEATSLNRITAFNATEVKLFFDQLEALQTKHSFPSHRIFNVDETGISSVQKNCRILAPKGLKQVAKATSEERGVITTVVCAVSANGIICTSNVYLQKKENERTVT